jgi:hypothetical protein
MEGRHRRRRIHVPCIDDAPAQLGLAPAVARAGEIGREIALQALLGDRAAVAQQAQPV